MRYILVSGSTRKNAQSLKVAQWLSEEITKASDENSAEIIDLFTAEIPVWDDTAWKASSELSQFVKPYQEKVKSADAIILISPEWHGMVPGGLKNFLLYLSFKHAAHKPCLLVGVSAGAGGSYPIAELRMSGYKNNHMVYIPDHLIIRNVEKMMNDHDFENADGDDKYIKNRAIHSLNALYAYTDALKSMRENHDLLDKAYPNGM